jgi:hypothetical protein
MTPQHTLRCGACDMTPAPFQDIRLNYLKSKRLSRIREKAMAIQGLTSAGAPCSSGRRRSEYGTERADLLAHGSIDDALALRVGYAAILVGGVVVAHRHASRFLDRVVWNTPRAFGFVHLDA